MFILLVTRLAFFMLAFTPGAFPSWRELPHFIGLQDPPAVSWLSPPFPALHDLLEGRREQRISQVAKLSSPASHGVWREAMLVLALQKGKFFWQQEEAMNIVQV